MKVLKSFLIIGSFLFSATALSQFGGFGGGGFQQPQGFGGFGGFPQQQFGGGFQQQHPYGGFGGGFGGGYPSFGGYGGGFGYPRFPHHYRRHNYQPVIRPTYINGPFNGPLFFGGGFRRW